MLKLRLIRHPKPQVASGICYGATDLLAEDEALAQQLDECLLMPKPVLVLSSPLKRCAALAQSLAARGWPEPVIDAGFAEMNFGDWEMQPWSKIERPQLDAWAADISGYCPPGGETVRQVAERALRAINRHWAVHRHLVDSLATNDLARRDSQGSESPGSADSQQGAVTHQAPGVVLICHSGVIQGLSHLLSGRSWQEFKPLQLAFGEVRDVLVPQASL
jgi:broad specificity phosphatase PhoE